MVSPLTQDVSIKRGPIRLPSLTETGELVLFETTNPYVAQPRQFGCLVLLATWLPASTPVAMFITYNVFTVDGCRLREVNMLYAASSFRGVTDAVDENGIAVTLPVAVGSWLFDRGFLDHHSADRSDRGDKWAHMVGGVIPNRVQTGTDLATSRNGALGLERLNAQRWPTWPAAAT